MIQPFNIKTRGSIRSFFILHYQKFVFVVYTILAKIYISQPHHSICHNYHWHFLTNQLVFSYRPVVSLDLVPVPVVLVVLPESFASTERL